MNGNNQRVNHSKIPIKKTKIKVQFFNHSNNL